MSLRQLRKRLPARLARKGRRLGAFLFQAGGVRGHTPRRALCEILGIRPELSPATTTHAGACH
ncbi:MAG: hypothetical protein RJQ08_03905 [Salinisphaeraceae bacterium]